MPKTDKKAWKDFMSDYKREHGLDFKRQAHEEKVKNGYVPFKVKRMREQNIAKFEDQLTNAAPLRGGIGMFLLQKMGWKSGEGLGKNNEGTLAPIAMEFKIDRKGLTSQGEGKQPRRGGFGGMGSAGVSGATLGAPTRIKDMTGKHPVSALMEICNRRRWGSPQFTMVQEGGPAHKKNFIFKVRVNNVEYQPAVASGNKKEAKSSSATVCLQELGMLPR